MINLIAFREVEHTEFENGENIELGSLMAFLKQHGFTAQYIYLDRNHMMGSTETFSDINVINVYNTTIDHAFSLISKVKKKFPQSVFFLFSRFATEASELILEEYAGIDGVILGHPEYPLLTFLNCIRDGKSICQAVSENDHIMSSYSKEGKYAKDIDINLLPVPDRSMLMENKATIAYLNTSYGCAGKCSFCGLFYRDKWTGRGAMDIFCEIISIYNKTGIRIFIFDDASFEDMGEDGKKKLFELCRLLIDYPVKFSFRCFMRTESFKETEEDIRLLEKLKKAGFVNILWGIEAGNETDLRLYQKRATVADNERIQRLLAQTGHDFLYGFIMMNPYSTVETLTSNVEYLYKIKCTHLEYYISAVRLWYGTALYQKLKCDELLIDEKDYKNYYNYHYVGKEVEAISNFMFQEFNFHNVLMEADYEEYHFEQFFRYLKHLFGKEVAFYEKELKHIQKKLLEEMYGFFAPVYRELDLEFAKEHVEDLKKNLEELYLEIKHLKLKVIKFYTRKQVK